MSNKAFLYLHIHPLAPKDCLPLHERFSGLQHRLHSLLLDSAGSSANENQYSFILWEPEHLVTQQCGRTVVHNLKEKQKSVSRADPLAVADSLLQEFKQNIVPVNYDKVPDNLPFQTGLAGLVGYDVARSYVNSIHSESHDKTDYATADVIIGLYCNGIIHCHQTNKQYYCCINNQPNTYSYHSDNLPAPSSDNNNEFSLTSPWRSNLTEQQYHDAIDRIHRYLVEGDCYQTNFSQRFSANYSGSLFSAYLALRDTNKSPFSAYMVTPHGAVISVSPERFLSVKNNKVETRPIKGTRPRSTNKEEDDASANALLNSEKDKAENLMIVDLLRNDLSKHCEPHSVDVPHLFSLESYEAVHHMVSVITGELKPQSTPLMLLKDAFPGGSITGAPKVRAMEIIEELEPHKRNVYCGSIFYNGWQNDMDSSICIRTLVAENGSLYCCAGGGIVIDSKASEEYKETFDKVAKIVPHLVSNE